MRRRPGAGRIPRGCGMKKGISFKSGAGVPAFRRIRGFTLIEVLLVVVIILIAAGVSVPLFRGTMQTTQMRDAVRSAVRIARYARSLAILRQETCQLRFGESQMTLDCGSSEPRTVRNLPADIRMDAFESPSASAAGADEERTVRFYSSGMNDGFSVTFRDEKDRRTTVTCHPVSGKMTVEEGL